MAKRRHIDGKLPASLDELTTPHVWPRGGKRLLWATVVMAVLGGVAGGLEIRSPGRFDHGSGRAVQHRAPVALNDNHDCGLVYQPLRVWDCRQNCPDGNCDHRTLEPVWDFLYVGGRVEGENDLLELEIVPPPGLPAGNQVVLTVVSGGDTVRLWPHPQKGEKREMLPNSGIAFGTGDLPRRIYAEGIKTGTAELRLSVEGGSSMPPFLLYVDVVRLVDSYKNKRHFIYKPGEVTLHLEPQDVLRSQAYRNRIVWQGDAAGKGPKLSQRYDPGRKPEGRRTVYHPRAVINGTLTLVGTVKVAQSEYTGTRLAWSIPERRREVEKMAAVPAYDFMDTALPNTPETEYSQAWFEKNFTGSSTGQDQVKPINAARLQYAPKFEHRRQTRGIACCYDAPVAAFITEAAYISGLRWEDMQGLAEHELRHLRHYAGIKTPGDVWNTLCTDLSHIIATFFMEADSYAVTLCSNGSWRYLSENGKNFFTNYLIAQDEIRLLPTRPQMEAGIAILKDIYGRLPPELETFKRSDYEYYIRPPLEIEEMAAP